MKLWTLGATAVAALIGSAANAQLADGGFETQGATVGNYCYFGQATPGGPACPNGPWTGTTGLQDEGNGAWPGLPSPDGSKYGFVQGQGTLSQTFTADQSGTFSLNWLEAARPQNGGAAGNQTYTVSLDAFDLGTFSTTSGQLFTARAGSTTFALQAGQSYTLTFTGLSTGDNTSYIDAVALNAAVPEPAAWALMIAGFGLIGAASRRRRSSSTVMA
jgi:hypothetical protein